MTRRAISISLEDDGNVKLKNDIDKELIITLQQKQIKAKEIFTLLDYKVNDKYRLEGTEKFKNDKIGGPKNEKFRLYNYVYEYIEGLIEAIDAMEIK